MSSKLHDRLCYIDEAKAWLSDNLDWLRPDIVCALTEWIAQDLAGWREGEPPSPPIEEPRLRALFGTSVPRLFFARRLSPAETR